MTEGICRNPVAAAFPQKDNMLAPGNLSRNPDAECHLTISSQLGTLGAFKFL